MKVILGSVVFLLGIVLICMVNHFSLGFEFLIIPFIVSCVGLEFVFSATINSTEKGNQTQKNTKSKKESFEPIYDVEEKKPLKPKMFLMKK